MAQEKSKTKAHKSQRRTDFSNIIKKLKNWKSILIFIGVIVTMTLSFNTYFAKSAELTKHKEKSALELKKHKQEFDDYKEYQRLEYLDKRLAQLEERHNCYEDNCRKKMPLSVWEEYTKKRTERKRLEKKLYPEQKEK